MMLWNNNLSKSALGMLMLASVAVDVVDSAIINIDPWTFGTYDDITVTVGDQINFAWTGNHDVWINPSGSCDQEGAIPIGASSPASYTFKEEDDGKDLFFVCNVGAHCAAGMQFTVSVGSDNGGDGGDDGDEATPPPLPDLFEPGDFATCGDCHCIPAEGESCPQPTPNNDFSGIVPSLQGLELVDDPFVLDCDPYTEEGCDTVPPLEQGEVCAYELMVENEVDECPSQYSLHTTSEQEAIDNGWLITHSGACGACSNHQDLIVYMENLDLTAEGKRCAAIGLGSERLGLRCYQELGMTEACAAIWLYNSLYTGDVCRAICIGFTATGNENNGPPPECELARCLQCDEDEAGPNFKKFAGRTRRGSGMLSAIVRRCDEVSFTVQQQDPCEFWKSQNTDAPSSEPSSAPIQTTEQPSSAPSAAPSTTPSTAPSAAPTSTAPSATPSATPSQGSNMVSLEPTSSPSDDDEDSSFAPSPSPSESGGSRVRLYRLSVVSAALFLLVTVVW